MSALAFGPYSLEERIGGGAMSEIWQARHRELGQEVALKRATNPDPGSDQRLLLEGRLLARLRSQHSLRVLGVGVARSETFLALELLEGVDLERLVVRHGPTPEARALHLLRQACSSVGELHRLGWVHRDLTPSNLMTCRFGLEVDRLKVVDFGIAARRDAPRQPPCGTPGYVAPEQQRGSVDPRSDVYALGCCAYFLLSGRPVFQARSAGELLEKHERELPLPLGEVAPVSPALEEVVLRALEKAPSNRFQDASVFGEALARLELDPWTPSQAEAWWEPVWPFTPRTLCPDAEAAR